MSLFYPKFALVAIRKNRRSYIPYILTTIFVTAMFLIIHTLSLTESFQGTFGADEIAIMMTLGSGVIAIFSLIFLFYTNSFLIKQRKKEFGLYSVLGMGKRHIAIILFYETLFVALFGVLLGILIGSLLNWAAFLVLMNMLGQDVNTPFSLNRTAIVHTFLLFFGIFLFIFLNDLRQVQFSSTISLLKSDSEGEREPRSKWVLAILGLLLLGAGYSLAVTITNPLGAFMLFFVAVILVILGTYCLFTCGSIVFLKLLRKNKRYYYKTNHFISVSGMLYRMKQNAVSLGNICILSAMVLVTVSSTMSLYVGSNGIVEQRAPRNLNLSIQSDTDTPNTTALAIETLNALAEEQGAVLSEPVEFRYTDFGTLQNGAEFEYDPNTSDIDLLKELTAFCAISAISLSDYNQLSGKHAVLDAGEVLIYSPASYRYDTLTVFGKTYSVLQTLSDFPMKEQLTTSAYTSYALVMADDTFSAFVETVQDAIAAMGYDATLQTYYGVNIDDPALEKTIAAQYFDRIEAAILECDFQETYEYWTYDITVRSTISESLFRTYAGLFFLGIFLGLLFLVATILIIYYKQVSEGLQDVRRYTIMRQVGLTEKEIRSSIHSQILTVFFLPLLTAFVHTAFAFPMIKGILNVLSMSDLRVFAFCLISCCGVFAVVYLAVYFLTSKVYYHIVNQM